MPHTRYFRQSIIASCVTLLLAVFGAHAQQEAVSDTALPVPDETVHIRKRAEIVKLADPVYPEVALREGQGGIVIVKVLLDEKGVVRDAKPAHQFSYPLLVKAAIDAAWKSEFKPAYDDRGFPAVCWFHYPVVFSIDRRNRNKYDTPRGFSILLIREKRPQSKEDLPTGELTLWGGFNDGLKPGMVGTVTRDNSIVGKVDIAYVEVTWVNGVEARCEYLMLDGDYFLEPWDRASFIAKAPAAPAILEQGLAAYSEGRYEDALTFLDEIWCLSRKNDFVKSIGEQCREKFDGMTREDLPKPTLASWRRRKLDFLRLGKEFMERNEPHLARQYINRVLLFDTANSIALRLKEQLPEDHYYENRMAKCILLDSILTGARLPEPGDRYPVDSVAQHTIPEGIRWPGSKNFPNGRLVVDVLIGTNDDILDVRLRRSCGSKDYDETAVEYARKGKCRSAYADGQPVPMWVNFSVAFSLISLD